MEYIKAFVFGGFLCVIAQIFIDKTKITPARILTGYVCSGVFLTGIGIYEPLVKIFGCGATVPLAKGVKDAVNADGFLGIFTGGITKTAGGIAAAIVFSFLFSLIFSGKPENL